MYKLNFAHYSLHKKKKELILVVVWQHLWKNKIQIQCQNVPFSKCLKRCNLFSGLGAVPFESALANDGPVHSGTRGPAALTRGCRRAHKELPFYFSDIVGDRCLDRRREERAVLWDLRRPRTSLLRPLASLPARPPPPLGLLPLPALPCKQIGNGSHQCRSEKKPRTSLLDVIKTPISSHRGGPHLSAAWQGGQMTLITAKMSC